MNKQTYELLSMLLGASNRRFTYRELADSLQVSTRSIRNYILTINAFLCAADLPAVEADAAGEVGFSGTFEQAQTARKRALSSTYYEYRLSPAERGTAIRLLLLSHEDFITLTEFALRLFVSRSTLVKDIEIVEREFSKEGVPFDEARHKGFRLNISEEHRRGLLEKCVLSLAESSAPPLTFGVYQSFVQQLLGTGEYEERIAAVMAQTELYYGIRFNDYCFQTLSLYLCILKARAAQGGRISRAGSKARALRGGIYEEMAAHILYQMAELDLPQIEEERLHLAYKIQHCIEGSAPNDTQDVVLQMTVKSFLYRISEALDMPLVRDEQLQHEIAEHLSSAKRGIRAGGPRRYLEAYKHQYPRTFSAVEACADTLQVMGYCSGEDEFTELLVLVLTAIERYHAQTPLLRIVVVCNSGTVTANFITEKLRRILQAEIKATIPLRLLPKLEEGEDFDLIISTIPLQTSAPWVQISPVLTQEDQQRIQRLISSLGKQREQAYMRIHPADKADGAVVHAVEIGVKAADWREAIVFAGGLLERMGKATPAYTAAMVETVERHGPYVVFAPGIAIAHAEPPANASYCASLIRLLHPVEFGHLKNDPVRYVIAVQSPDETAHLSSLFQLMSMMSNAALLSSLDRATTNEEVWQAIQADTQSNER